MADAASLKELYRRTVLEHSREPHRFGRLETADQSATGHNPLCGDKCTVYLRIDDDSIADISFEGAGCAICMASASIMTDAVHGQRLEQAQTAAAKVLGAFDRDQQAADEESLHGDMAALGAVRGFPTRIRCVTLPWKTLQASLAGLPTTVTTETSH